MRVGLLNIGDEILAGKILNTNARDLAVWLEELGHEVAFMGTIPDGVDALVGALRNLLGEPAASSPSSPSLPSSLSASLSRPDMLILSGGLGPTQDDFTREALAAYLGVPLERSLEATAWLAARLNLAADAISPGQATQLLVPRGVMPLHNTAGTACGLRFNHSFDPTERDQNACTVFAFPGVPSEFRTLFDAYCRPMLQRRDARLLRRRVVTFGLSESKQRDLLRGLIIPDPFRFSSLPNAAGVTISLEAFAPQTEAPRLQTLLDATWEALLARLPSETIVDRNGSPLLQTVFELLRDNKKIVSVAESCTGGLVGHLLTSIPGSSAVFEQGFITYSNEAKHALLGVPRAVLSTHGAVSEECALAMARGCRNTAGSDYAISVTGIAGPDGGAPEKPVGLVYIGVAAAHGEECARFLFREDRDGNRKLSAYTALNLLRLRILRDLQPE